MHQYHPDCFCQRGRTRDQVRLAQRAVVRAERRLIAAVIRWSAKAFAFEAHTEWQSTVWSATRLRLARLALRRAKRRASA